MPPTDPQNNEPESPTLDRSAEEGESASGLKPSTLAAIKRAEGDLSDVDYLLDVHVKHGVCVVFNLREAVWSLRNAADALERAAEDELRS